MLKKLLKNCPKLEQLYYDNYWRKGSVMYATESGKDKTDVRLACKHSLPSDVGLWCNSLGGSDDSKALECLKWVITNIIYKPDDEQWGKPEKWQTPAETVRLGTGDCEDMSILLLGMLRIAGILAYRRKVACGLARNVFGQMVGHAYVLYLTDERNWAALDASFYPEESVNNFGVPQKEVNNYSTIWFTFNEENAWHQHSTTILY